MNVQMSTRAFFINWAISRRPQGWKIIFQGGLKDGKNIGP